MPTEGVGIDSLSHHKGSLFLGLPLLFFLNLDGILNHQLLCNYAQELLYFFPVLG